MYTLIFDDKEHIIHHQEDFDVLADHLELVDNGRYKFKSAGMEAVMKLMLAKKRQKDANKKNS